MTLPQPGEDEKGQAGLIKRMTGVIDSAPTRESSDGDRASIDDKGQLA